jgi:excisionase family DNA binding protein
VTSVQITIPAELVEMLAEQLEERIRASGRQARWLTVSQAVDHLGLSSNSIRALIKRKRIPHYRVEGRILFDRGELDQWVRGEGQRP